MLLDHREEAGRPLRDGWFFTGDRYRVDADGVYWYEGRADDMIKVGGLWVSPVEMENVLIAHEAVAESAMVGTSVDGLTKVKAYVVLKKGAEPSEDLMKRLQAWRKSHLHRYQYPHEVELVADLPKTVTDKIQRFKLR